MVDLNATLIAQIINFLILVAILAKFAYKPLMKALADRKAHIAASIEAAEKDKLSAQNLKQQYEEQLVHARFEAQAIVDKATKLAEQTREEIIADAKAEQARILKAAQEEIVREREQALAEVRAEVVSISLAAASKIIGQNLDVNANAKLVSDFIDKLDKQKIGAPC